MVKQTLLEAGRALPPLRRDFVETVHELVERDRVSSDTSNVLGCDPQSPFCLLHNKWKGLF